MSFADALAQTDLAVAFFLRISGLPYLFSNIQAPVSWMHANSDADADRVEFEGDVYEWSPTLIVDEGFAAVSQNLAPKAGLGSVGGLNFRFRVRGHEPRVGGLWLHLLTNAVPRTDGFAAGTLMAPLDDGITSVTGAKVTVRGELISPVDLPGVDPIDVMVGHETMSCSTTDVITTSGTQAYSILKRAKYGSREVSWDPELSSGVGVALPGEGPTAALYPVAVEDRYVELYAIAGTLTDGRFIPHGKTGDFGPESSYVQSIYSGVINVVDEEGLNAIVETTSLDKTFARDAAQIFPEARAGREPISPASILLETHNRHLHFSVTSHWFSGCFIHVWAFGLIDVGDTVTIRDDQGTLVRTITAKASGLQTATEFAIDAADALELLARIGTSLRMAGEAEYSGAGSSPWLLKVEGGANPTAANVYFNFANVQAEGLVDPQLWTLEVVSDGMITTQPFIQPRGDGTISVMGAVLQRAPGETDPDTNRAVDPGATTEDVPPGNYPLSVLAGYIQATLNKLVDPWQIVPDVHVKLRDDEDGNPRVFVQLSIRPAQLASEVEWSFWGFRNGKESFLLDLGFDDGEHIFPPETSIVDSSVSEIEPERGPAAWRWPAITRQAPSQVWYHGELSDWHRLNLVKNDDAVAYYDDAGNRIDPHWIIADREIVRVDTTAFGGSFERRVTLLARNLFGTGDTDEIYVEWTKDGPDATHKIRRYPAFPGVSAGRLIGYLLHGGNPAATHTAGAGEFGKGLKTWGLGLPGRFSDLTTYSDSANDATLLRDSWVFVPGRTAREVVSSELVLAQYALTQSLGQLKLRKLRPPAESDVLDAYALDASNLVPLSSGDYKFDRTHAHIVNVVQVESGFDAARKRFNFEGTFPARNSILDYGAKRKVTLKVYGLLSQGDLETQALVLAQRITESYGRPYAIIELLVSDYDAWLVEIGDAVRITDDTLKHPTKAQRGVTDLLGRVYVKADYFTGSDTASGAFAKLTVIVRAFSGRRWSRFAPAAESQGKTADDRYTFKPHAFSRDSDPTDVERFAVDDSVRLTRLGTGDVEYRQIAEISLDTPPDVYLVRFSSSLPSAWGAIIMEYDRYNDADTQPAQRRFVYMAGLDARLTLPDLTKETAYYYM